MTRTSDKLTHAMPGAIALVYTHVKSDT